MPKPSGGRAIVDKVNDFLRSRRLTAAEAKILIDAANAIITSAQRGGAV